MVLSHAVAKLFLLPALPSLHMSVFCEYLHNFSTESLSDSAKRVLLTGLSWLPSRLASVSLGTFPTPILANGFKFADIIIEKLLFM